MTNTTKYIILLLTFPILFNSCKFRPPYNYINNAINLPMVKEKGDIEIDIFPALNGLMSYTVGNVELQAAGGVTKNLGLTGQLYLDTEGKYYYDFGLMLYKKQKYHQFNILTGYGKANINLAESKIDSRYSYQISSGYHKFYIQPSYSFHLGELTNLERVNFKASIGLRTSYLIFPEYEYLLSDEKTEKIEGNKYSSSLSQIILNKNDINTFSAEPFIQLDAGGQNMHITLQFGYTFMNESFFTGIKTTNIYNDCTTLPCSSPSNTNSASVNTITYQRAHINIGLRFYIPKAF